MKKSILSLMITLACLSASAIEQDSEGYYLIGSVDDWKAFAQIVNSGTNTAANAKMTADVNLGDDQTHIGSMTQNQAPFYGGVFDGQGHTLTVAYVGESNRIMGVFAQTRNATIKNLHVAGSIHSSFAFVGVVGCSNAGIDVISNVWNSADITVQFSGWNWTGGIAGGVDAGGSLSIIDCLFTGTISAAGSYNGCFLGYLYRGSAAISNCLSTGTISSGAFSGSHTNCYVKRFPAAIPATMQCTDATLADGTVATALQAGRDEEVWVQDAALGSPMLKIFVTEEEEGLKQDDEGYYLIGSVDDWKAFAEIVNETPNANARMIADVDLGDDQTVLGSPTVSTTAYSLGGGSHYKGIFDGQGHTLKVAYNASGTNSASPFSSIEGATIKNLHIDGTMISPKACGAGVASATGGDGNLIENVWVSVDITANGQSWNCSSGIVGCVKNGSVTIRDCVFSGNVICEQSHNGCFVGYIDRGSATVVNCLSTGTFSYTGGSNSFNGSHTNCYVKQFSTAIPSDMQCTDETLSDGTIATALQAGREEEVWTQDIELNIPMLKLFASPDKIKQDDEGYYLIGSVDNWKEFAAIVNETPTANARMIADIDLGDDQTMIGEISPYKGIFDGQGHKLSYAYNSTADYTAPFRFVGGAIIKYLHLSGTISTTLWYAGGIIACASSGVNHIEQCYVDVDIHGIGSSANERSDWHGGFVGRVNGGQVYINDCIGTGIITSVRSNASYCTAFFGLLNSSDNPITNSLSTLVIDKSIYAANGAFHYIGGTSTITNSFSRSVGNKGTQQTTAWTEQGLADGSVATLLQNNRTATVWVQDRVLGIPMLKLFAQSVLKGDLNDDGFIDGSDVSAMLEIVLTGGEISAEQLLAGDFNGDGRIDGSDVSALLELVLSGE